MSISISLRDSLTIARAGFKRPRPSVTTLMSVFSSGSNTSNGRYYHHSGLNHLMRHPQALMYNRTCQQFCAHQFYSTTPSDASGPIEFIHPQLAYKSSGVNPSFRHASTSNRPKEKSFRPSDRRPHHRSNEQQKQLTLTEQNLRHLSNRLSFFFSSANLRHDAYARSILSQHDNKYLPMEVILSFKSIAKITNNYKIILEAANLINEEYEKRGEDLPLEAFVTDDGEVMLGRRKEFDYESSLEANYKKILFVEGWPERLNTRWAEERVRNLLADNYGIQSALEKKNTESIVYWGKDVAKGVITVEFTTEQDANRAWENLEKNLLEHANIPDAKPTHSKIVVRPSKESNISAAKRYNLQIGELELVVRGLAKGEKEVVELSSEQLIAKTVKKISDKKVAAAADSKLEKKVDQLTPPVVTEREKKWWCNKSTTPSLSQCIKAMNELYCIHQTLPPPPREWLHESRFNKRYTRHGKSSKTSQKLQVHRRELLRDVVSIVGCMQNSIRKGVIRALGSNDAYALSEFLTRAMLILSESPVDHGVDVDDNHSGEPISPYNACQDALAILHSLNLDVHPNHYSHAIRSACHESLWEEAAAIFLSQIEGDDTTSDNEFSTDVHTGGFTPVDPTLGWDTPLEIGLYAVAADAFYRIRKIDDSEEVELSPSKIVFDTAMKMSMVAPSNQESYVLAAGSALGRAGLWSDCLDFCTDQSNLAKFGPSLAAAAMLSCIESSRSAEAIELYNYFFNSENQSTASEWQWAGGNLSAAKPLFDDLLLRAMGGVSGGGFSGDAIGKFCELVDNVPFSGNALLGLMHSIEYDGDWLSAIKLLEAFCDSHFRKRESKWRLVNEMLSLSGVDIEDAHAPTKAELEDLLSKMLASTMRTCNREGFFSLSLLVSSITNSFLNEGFSDELFRPDDESMIKAISAQKLLESEAVRNAYVQSLYRVGLKRIVHTMSASDDGANTPLKNTQTQTLSPTTEALLNALATTNQLLMAIDEIQHDNTPLSDEDRILFMRGISRAMNFYMDADHPASAMHIFQYANNVLAKKRNILATKGTSYLETVRTFFDDDRSESTAGHQIFANKAHDYQSLCDPLLASVIRAYAMSGHPEEALAIFEDATSQQRHESPSPDTIQSFNIALEVLLENDIDKFMSLFQNANSDFLVPSTFLAVARSYARDGAWPEIGEVYNKARRRGCVSEELGFIAMQAVCEAELLDGKITVLRKIADDISNTVGMKTEEWISSQYWYIKRYVGFHYARLLMNWNTPATSQKQELLFAINEMRRCSSQGVLTKNAILFCIAKQGELYASADGSKNISNLTESQRRAAINIIFEACAEAHLSGLIKRPTFTAEVVRSLHALDGDKQCIQFVKTLIANNEKCRHRVAMEYAIRAASEIRDFDSLEMIIAAFENSGYDSRRLSM